LISHLDLLQSQGVLPGMRLSGVAGMQRICIVTPMSEAQRKSAWGFPSLVSLSSQVTLGTGILVLCGWKFDIDIIQSGLPGLVSMKANTAFCFILAGLAMYIEQGRPHSAQSAMWRRSVVIGTAVLTSIIGGLTLAEYALGRNAGIDEILFQDRLQTVETSNPGRMAPLSALNFLLLGLVLVVRLSKVMLARWFVQLSTLLILWVSVLALLGYARDAQALYRNGFYTSMSLPTAALFAVLALTILDEQRKEDGSHSASSPGLLPRGCPLLCGS